MPTKRTNPSATRASRDAEISADRNALRRAEYASVPGVADAARAKSRERSAPASHNPARLSNGLLYAGVVREVTHEDIENPTSVESFTIPEFARAIGKSELTVRRWIEADKIPTPYLRETSKNHRVYSIGEAQVMSRVLQRREAEFVYLTSTDHLAIAEMHEHMHAYRAHHI